MLLIQSLKILKSLFNVVLKKDSDKRAHSVRVSAHLYSTRNITQVTESLECLRLTLPVPYILESCINPSRPNPGRREAINISFYFYTSLWCLKRFYEGTTKKCEN